MLKSVRTDLGVSFPVLCLFLSLPERAHASSSGMGCGWANSGGWAPGAQVRCGLRGLLPQLQVHCFSGVPAWHDCQRVVMEGKFSRRLGGPQGVAKLKRASSLTVNYFNSILLSAFFNSLVFVWFLTFIDTNKFGHERKLWSLREGLSNFHEGMFFMLGDVWHFAVHPEKPGFWNLAKPLCFFRGLFKTNLWG